MPFFAVAVVPICFAPRAARSASSTHRPPPTSSPLRVERRTSNARLTHSPDNSANSGLQVHTLLNPDDSPLRNSIPTTPQSAGVRNSTASGGSQFLPSINQGFHQDGNRDSYASIDSRRSSADSRMHQTFSNMYINTNNNNGTNPVSPYESASQNGSHTSLAQSLRRPGPGGPMSPLSGRTSLRGNPAPRIAPPIAPAGQRGAGADPTAARPTPGFAWAFPEEPIPEERNISDSDESSPNDNISRANSFAASSIRSSIFSNDSQMPQGQRRFEEGKHSGQVGVVSGAHADNL